MAANKKELRPASFFLLGLVSLLALHAEKALILIEKYIYSKEYTEFSITESVTHWIVTCVMWGILGLVLFYVTARFYGFDIVKKDRKPSMRGLVIALLLLSSSIGVKYILLGGWQMAVDFKREGWFQFIFLYIYHLFEAVLLLFSAAFFQEGCERLIPKNTDHVPWGGIIIALTWGLLKLTGGDLISALFYTAVAFFIGCAHLAAKKNLYISYAFAAVLILV